MFSLHVLSQHAHQHGLDRKELASSSAKGLATSCPHYCFNYASQASAQYPRTTLPRWHSPQGGLCGLDSCNCSIQGKLGLGTIPEEDDAAALEQFRKTGFGEDASKGAAAAANGAAGPSSGPKPVLEAPAGTRRVRRIITYMDAQGMDSPGAPITLCKFVPEGCTKHECAEGGLVETCCCTGTKV